MTLTEFILARIAEDEARANHAKWAMQGEWFTTADDKVDEYVRGLSPARVLAECAALRAVVTEVQRAVALVDPSVPATYNFAARVTSTTLRALAAIWSDHPDYRPEEWA